MALVKHNNNSISAVTSMASLTTGSMTLIKEQTASSSASVSFVDGSGGVVLDSTYPIYKFDLISIHPSTDLVSLQFNMSTDGGSNYNVTKTSTFFRAFHEEDDTGTPTVQYFTGSDLAQSTSDQRLTQAGGNANDEADCASLFLFNPSSTTFVKHFLGTGLTSSLNETQQQFYIGGYGNTTSAVNAIKFQMDSGNIDSGTIKLYGIKDS
jgi:hypothetical protein